MTEWVLMPREKWSRLELIMEIDRLRHTMHRCADKLEERANEEPRAVADHLRAMADVHAPNQKQASE